jgi:Tfp pilus assembly protein FimT
MQTCEVRMPIKRIGNTPCFRCAKGFVLAEMVVVICLIGLFVSMAMINVTSLLGRNSFKAQAEGLAATLRMAAAKAAESSRRYEVIVDPQTQSYTFREITSGDLAADVLQEEIIRQHVFGGQVRIKYVEFDDREKTADTAAKFRAGRAGWQYGGKIVLMDEDNNDYTIMVNRLSRTVELLDGDVEQLEPVEDLVF